MKKHYLINLLLLVCFAMPSRSWAQAQNWYFGDHAALSFESAGPVALTTSAMLTFEGCTALSTTSGQLLAYSNGEMVWDAQHQVMPNGRTGLGGNNSTSQGALFLPLPGNPTNVFLFCLDAIENNLVGGLRYSILDFTLRGGLGDVTLTKGVVLPTPLVGGKVTEKLTAVRHANGRDYWIVVHGWQSNAFYSFLLSPTGISAMPVTSNVGAVHQGGGSFFGAANAVGCMKASPDGRHLALAQRDSQCELYDFDNVTGGVSNYVRLASHDYTYGVEFSPDNSKLYTTYSLDGQIVQYNLLAGSTAAIINSASVVANSERLGNLVLGPDNKIYVASYNNAFLNVIQNPNAAGTACRYVPRAVMLAGKNGLNGLPNFPNAYAPILTAAFTGGPGCVGSAVAFAGTVQPATSGATATWNFGDPASGAANVASGLAPTHTYAAAGTYQVTLTVTVPGVATPLTATQTVLVLPLPQVNLGSDVVVCASQFQLAVGSQPAGTTYRWQDGSTSATYLAQASGAYTVLVTTPQGCTSTASSRVQLGSAPLVSLGADTLVCPNAVWVVRVNAQPAGTRYRWQDGSTAPTFLAHGPGCYTVEVRATATSCPTSAARVATAADCPIVIPNIITPNGDPQNEFFTLKGLTPSEWHLRIFDRWGRQVYERARYDNSWNAAGQVGGSYYYLLSNEATGERYQGWVEVMRGS